ncbi:MAG: WYL domain-containing protein [Actinobacteria bacterium]|nr:WYL domain-containing protein [Actinomycetota bacterium]
MAANLWHDSALQNDSKAALLKIQSLSGPIGSDEINTPAIRDNQSSQVLSIAFNAVDKQQKLSFQYKERPREVEPYGLYTRDGFWYLVAQEDRSVKSFKLLRIEGALTTVGKVGGFKKPSDFDLAAFLEHSKNEEISVAHLHVRKEQAFALRSKYATIEIDDEWDLMEVEYSFEQEIIETVLWHGLNVVVVKPENLQKQIISKIKELANG